MRLSSRQGRPLQGLQQVADLLYHCMCGAFNEEMMALAHDATMSFPKFFQKAHENPKTTDPSVLRRVYNEVYALLCVRTVKATTPAANYAPTEVLQQTTGAADDEQLRDAVMKTNKKQIKGRVPCGARGSPSIWVASAHDYRRRVARTGVEAPRHICAECREKVRRASWRVESSLAIIFSADLMPSSVHATEDAMEEPPKMPPEASWALAWSGTVTDKSKLMLLCDGRNRYSRRILEDWVD